MPTNHFLQRGEGIGSDNEHKLFQQLVDESIFNNGVDFHYCPRELVSFDNVFNEDTLSAFKKYYVVEMFIANYEGYGGNTDYLSKFGLYINKNLRLFVSKTKFEAITGEKFPSEGDIIYFKPGKALFQILHVEEETPFYMLGKNYTFELTCEAYKYSQEDLDTGFEEIDSIQDNFENNDDPTNDPFQKNTFFDDINKKITDDTEKNPIGSK